VLDVTPTTVTITWTPSTDNVGVVDYFVYQGDQFYSTYIARIVPAAGPVTLTLNPTAANTNFAIAARDAAGNLSSQSSRSYVRQPPTYPKSGDDTVPPGPVGTPAVVGVTPDGGYILSWAPATDNIAVLEYHVYHTFNIDEVRVEAKVSTNSAVIRPRGGTEFVTVVAYDAAWNFSSVGMIPLGPPPTPTPTPPPPAGR
jgi:hypothetical protein